MDVWPLLAQGPAVTAILPWGRLFPYRAWPLAFHPLGSPSLKYLWLRAARPSTLWTLDVVHPESVPCFCLCSQHELSSWSL